MYSLAKFNVQLAKLIRQIPLSIESRLSTLSFNEKIFLEALPPYQKASQNSGYRHTLTYKSPPFNLKTKTKVDKLFLNLLDKLFPPYNKAF